MLVSLVILLSAINFWTEQPDFQISSDRACEALEDMNRESEALPTDLLGRPLKFDWMSRGRVGMGNDPKSFSQLIPWAVVLAAPHNRKESARVQIKNLEVFLLSKTTGRWSRGSFPEHWKGAKLSHRLRNQVVGELKVELGTDPDTLFVDANSIAHFWPEGGRRPIDSEDIAGVYVTIQARLDPSDYKGGGRYLMNMAADYWRSNSARWDNLKSNGDVAISRLKYLRPEWRRFSMATLEENDLQRTCRNN